MQLFLWSLAISFGVGISAVDWIGETTHDFGDLSKNETAVCYFYFRNNQSFPITIDNIRTDCGCTAPDWSETPIEAQSTDSIRIEFDAHKPGYFRKHIRVYFHHQRKAEHLYIEGYVEE